MACEKIRPVQKWRHVGGWYDESCRRWHKYEEWGISERNSLENTTGRKRETLTPKQDQEVAIRDCKADNKSGAWRARQIQATGVNHGLKECHEDNRPITG